MRYVGLISRIDYANRPICTVSSVSENKYKKYRAILTVHDSRVLLQLRNKMRAMRVVSYRD